MQKTEIKTNDLTFTRVLAVFAAFSCLFLILIFLSLFFVHLQLHNVTLALDLLIDRGFPVQSIDPQGNYFETI